MQYMKTIFFNKKGCTVKQIKITIAFLILLTICVNARTNSYNNYLKTGIGVCLISDISGPALMTEYAHNLNQNLFIVSKFLRLAVIDENKYPKSSDYNSYYNLGLGLQYRFSSLERLGLGFGGNLQLINRVYLREYEIHENLVRNITNTFDFLYGFYSSIDYAVIQRKNTDFGVNGIAQFGEYSSFSVLIYMKFKI